MTYLRSHLTFLPEVRWSQASRFLGIRRSSSALRAVVDHCIERGAYKKFRGVTARALSRQARRDTFLTLAQEDGLQMI